MKLLSSILIILAILNGLDYVTTIYGVGSGKGVEANPASRALMEAGMFDEVKVGVGIMLGIVGLLALEVEKRGYVLSDFRLSFIWYLVAVYTVFVVLLYIAAVINNLFIVMK